MVGFALPKIIGRGRGPVAGPSKGKGGDSRDVDVAADCGAVVSPAIAKSRRRSLLEDDRREDDPREDDRREDAPSFTSCSSESDGDCDPLSISRSDSLCGPLSIARSDSLCGPLSIVHSDSLTSFAGNLSPHFSGEFRCRFRDDIHAIVERSRRAEEGSRVVAVDDREIAPLVEPGRALDDEGSVETQEILEGIELEREGGCLQSAMLFGGDAECMAALTGEESDREAGDGDEGDSLALKETALARAGDMSEEMKEAHRGRGSNAVVRRLNALYYTRRTQSEGESSGESSPGTVRGRGVGRKLARKFIRVGRSA